MHSLHLPLTKWFSAVYLIAAHAGSVSARQLQTRLRIAYQTASVLKRKLQLTETPVDSESLRGRIEVAQTEISFKVFDPFLELSRNLGDDGGQAASGGWLTASMPSMNFIPLTSFGN
jgi:hypothetical protein